MSDKRYFIRMPDKITHFIVVDLTNRTVSQECVDMHDHYGWIYMFDAEDPGAEAINYLEKYVGDSLYYELTEDEFYKTRITLKYEKILET